MRFWSTKKSRFEIFRKFSLIIWVKGLIYLEETFWKRVFFWICPFLFNLWWDYEKFRLFFEVIQRGTPLQKSLIFSEFKWFFGYTFENEHSWKSCFWSEKSRDFSNEKEDDGFLFVSFLVIFDVHLCQSSKPSNLILLRVFEYFQNKVKKWKDLDQK